MLNKKALIIFLLLTSAVTYAQHITKFEKATDFSWRVYGDNFSGAVFSESYVDDKVSLAPQNGKIYANGSYMFFPDEIKRFKRYTPTEADINDTELILQSQIKSMAENLPKIDLVGGPDIAQNMGRYLRQYFGFINDRGEKVIFINAAWNQGFSNDLRELTDEFYRAFDGGNNFWQAKVNVTTHKLFNLGVNGGA